MSSPTLTHLGKRVERAGEPRGERREVFGSDSRSLRTPNAERQTPRLRAIDWHRAWLRALASVEDKEAQDAAGSYHMQQLARYLREEREARAAETQEGGG